MAVVAKPDGRRSNNRTVIFLGIALTFLVGFAFSRQDTPNERVFANPIESSPGEKPLLRRGNPAERKPGQTAKVNRLVSFDLAQLKTGGKGTIVFEIFPEWAPLGVAHFSELLDADFYTDCRIFRVVPNFVAQFGMSGDPQVQRKWAAESIKDDPVVQSNTRGTLTYATSGKNSRTTQLFINFADNGRLDGMGFAPIGKVVQGEEFLDQIQDKYREKPGQNQIRQKGNAYLEEKFPDLTYIESVRIE